MSDGDDRTWDGFLDGLEGQAREERLELLTWLAERGYGDDELRRGHADGLLAFLPAERLVMGGAPTLSAREVAREAGIDLDLFQEVRASQGLPTVDPDSVEFATDEVHAARMPVLFATLGMSEAQMLAISRVLGRGLTQTAQVMRRTVLELTLEPGLRERELAERYEATVGLVLPHIGQLLENVARTHLRDMVRGEAVDARARQEGAIPGVREVTVAFADLVGFTRMGQEVPPEEVGRVAARLEVLGGAVAGGSVRLVKTIGDAVMLVADEPGALVLAGLDLLEAVADEGEDFPQLRVGVAHGSATPLSGDWFGAPVNLASRMTSLARTGSLLAEQSAHEAAGGDARLNWSFAGDRRVRGVQGTVKTFRARRATAA